MKFKPNKLTLAMLSTGMIALGGSQLIAEEAVEEEKAEQEEENVITVSGYRRSIVESISTKRYASSVVESITAEDIGKLPDSSIAESIARLPGLAAQRLDGRASKVTIRGFGENESGTTFNGREQVSINDNRGVEFDLYPSEIMSGVTVYKTPDAATGGDGIAGVIDLQTVKPLSKNEQIIQFNGQYEMTSFEKLNPDGDDSGMRGTFTYMDKFADDTVGVAFAYSTMSSPNQEKRWNAWGYPEFDPNNGDNTLILGGAKPFVRSSTLERDTAMLVVEAAVSDNVKITFDALDIDFVDEKHLRGIEIPFAWGQGARTPLSESNGFYDSATTTGQRVVVRNDFETREADLTNIGLNIEWSVSEDWDLEIDASSSKVDREVFSLESYSGTGRGDNNGVADTLTYTMGSGNAGATFTHGLDYSDYSLIQLGGPLTWGWSSALNDSQGITGTPWANHAQDGFINAPEIDDELKSLRFVAKQNIEDDVFSGITYGVSYTERDKNKVDEGYFLTHRDFNYPTSVGTFEVPEQYRLGTVSLDFLGLGNMIAYDSVGLVRDGYYTQLQESITQVGRLTNSWNVNEEVTTIFTKADINTELNGMELSGNIGMRYVMTDQSSDGFAGNVDNNGVIVASPTFEKHDFKHWLPSLNLSLQLDDDQTVRLGIAQTISRPRLDEMHASFNISYNPNNPDDNGNNWSVGGGNPRLEPKEATGLDLTYENYFSAEGYFSMAYFYKDLTNWIFDGTYEVDVSGVADPDTGFVATAGSNATGSGKVNGGGGDLSGYELSLTLPLGEYSDALDGFGLVMSHTGLDSDIKDINGNKYQLPGLSDEIQTLTFYYDLNGFSARASMRKRSDFKGEVYGISFSSQQVDIIGETIWDAQLGYDFGAAGVDGFDGLSIFFQALNITEEPFTSYYNGDPLQVRDYQDYGSTYLLGFSYKL